MITAVDTSVLIAIYRSEMDGQKWVARLADCRNEGLLVICDVVAAEFFSVIMDEREYTLVLRDLGLVLSPCNLETAKQAGRSFRQYRTQGGPRAHLIPDFLVGAHAQVQADRLAALDGGFLRRYFAGVSLVALP